MAVHITRTLLLGCLLATGGGLFVGCDDSVKPGGEPERDGGPRLPTVDEGLPIDFGPGLPDADTTPMPDAEVPVEMRRLVIEGDDEVTAFYGADVALQIRYLGADGQPAAGTIKVELINQAGDTVQDVAGTTVRPSSRAVDAEGRASFTLRAGQADAQFAIEARADLATPVRWTVSVRRNTQGSLAVRAVYPEPRRYPIAAVPEVRVGLFNGNCDTVRGTPRSNLVFAVEPPRINPFDGDDTSAIGALPDGARFAAVALGYNEVGRVLALGCTDDAAVLGGGVNTIRVDLADEPMEYKGTFDVVHDIELTSVLEDQNNPTLATIAQVIEVLDALGAESGERGRLIIGLVCDFAQIDPQDCQILEFFGPLVDDLIDQVVPQNILDAVGLVGDVARIMTHTTILGQMVFSSSYPDAEGMLPGNESRFNGLRFAWRQGCMFPDRARCTRDFSLIDDAGLPARSIVSQFDAQVLAEDRLALGPHTLRMHFGRIAIGILESWLLPEVLGRPGPVTITELVGELLPCAEINDAITGNPNSGFCEAALATPLAQLVYDALEGLGFGLDVLTFEGEVTVTDENPDLQVDHLVDGVWNVGFGETEDLTPNAGTFSGCRAGECEPPAPEMP